MKVKQDKCEVHKVEYKVLKKKEQKQEKWSGGKTTELGIYPKFASRDNKDFIWRLSTATCKRSKAKFTSYEGFDRVLFSLAEGNVIIHSVHSDAENQEEVKCNNIDTVNDQGHNSQRHNAMEGDITIGELEKFEFDGGNKIIAEGLERDYNLIINKDCKYKVDVIDQIQAGAGVNNDKAVPVGESGDAKFLSIDSIIKGKRVPLNLASEEGFDHVTQALYCVDGFSSVHVEVADMSLVTNPEDAPVDIKIMRLAEGEQLTVDYKPTEKIKMTIKGAGRLIHLQLFYN